VKQTRVVANPREFAGYTFGYNHALFAQRTHDVLTIVTYLRKAQAGLASEAATRRHRRLGSAGPIVAAARALAGEAIDRAAVDTQGFRFGQVLDYRDPMFLPGSEVSRCLRPARAERSSPALARGEGDKPESLWGEVYRTYQLRGRGRAEGSLGRRVAAEIADARARESGLSLACASWSCAILPTAKRLYNTAQGRAAHPG